MALATITWQHQQKVELKANLPAFISKVKADGKVYLYHELHFSVEDLIWELTMYVRDNNKKELEYV